MRSAFIRVFDADLTFEGGDPDAQCNVEAETGFFMAAGPARKSLSLSLYPSDPDAVFPEWFQYWWQHDPQPPPPYGTGLSLIGPGCVSFYSQPESGEVLTDLSWGWEETEPYVFTETATPAQVYVQAVTPGTCTISMNLSFNTWDSCWPPEADAWDTVKVTVVGVDLSIDGVPYTQEEDPGGFVALGGSRKKIMLSVLPSTVRPVKLEVTAGAGKVELYDAPTGGSPLGNHLEYQTAAQVPTQLWVQGVAASDGLHDVVLTLDAAPAGQHATDTVRFTVIGVDLVVAEVDEAHEMDPGAFVRLNTDDDEPNGQQDILDAPSVDEDDLVGMTLAVSPGGIVGNVTLDATQGKSRVRVWPSATKTGAEVTLPPNPAWTTGNMPAELHLEGCAASAGLRDVELVLQYTGYGLTVSDTAKVTVLQVDVDADSDRSGAVNGTWEEESSPAIMMVNNDDDGLPEGWDNANSVVDGGGDAFDLAELVIRGTPLPEGWRAVVGIGPADRARVFDAAATAVLGPGLGTSYEIAGFSTQDLTCYAGDTLECC